jgi:hypothetical protein
MIDRRSFVGVVTCAIALSATRRSSARADRIGSVGVQLYTVRHEMQCDFEGTLAKIAAIGYREVEFIEPIRSVPCRGKRNTEPIWPRHAFIPRQL